MIFKGDEATKRRLQTAVLSGLRGLLESLPEVPPNGVDDVNAYAVAHGFFCRVARTCEAALLLVDAGLGSESAPLRRASLEHVLALTWVIDEGDAAAASLLRVHKSRMASIQTLADGRWDIAQEGFEHLLQLDVPGQGQDHLTRFGQLAQTYASSSDLMTAWLADTGNSHPSHLTASAYWRESGSRRGCR